MNDIERFESKYVKSPNGCWLWIAALSEGYGKFWYKKELRRAHRVSYEIYVADIPKGLCVLHKCNTRNCINPKHLYLGTYVDNVRDSIAAGTFRGLGYRPHRLSDRRGENHPRAKLTNGDVVCIKKMLRDNIQHWLIAWIYQLRRGTITAINTGKLWSHIKIYRK